MVCMYSARGPFQGKLTTMPPTEVLSPDSNDHPSASKMMDAGFGLWPTCLTFNIMVIDRVG